MQNIIKQRTKTVIAGTFLIVFICVFFYIFYAQIILHNRFNQANNNIDRYRLFSPNRSRVYDRNNHLLVNTVRVYDLLVIMDRFLIDTKQRKNKSGYFIKRSFNYESINNLAKLLNIPQNEILSKITKIYEKKVIQINKRLLKHKKWKNKKPQRYKRTQQAYEYYYFNKKEVLYKNISQGAAMKIRLDNSRMKETVKGVGPKKTNQKYSGFFVRSRFVRKYPGNNFAPHILRRIFKNYKNDDVDILLTIDFRAQKLAEKLLDEAIDTLYQRSKIKYGGAVVVIDIHSGEIVVMASSPRTQFLMNTNHILMNKAITSSVSPSSIFGVFLGLYALQKNHISSNITYRCRGYMEKRGQFRCTHVHGNTNMERAIEGACSIYFYSLGEKVGLKELEKSARVFGFGEKSGLGFLKEKAGYIPTLGERVGKEKRWTKEDDRLFGAGENMRSTPLQIARAMAMVARKGTMPKLHIVKQIQIPPRYYNGKMLQKIKWKAENEVIRTFPIEERHWKTIVRGMTKVVHGREGTARNIENILGNLIIASKTGTSQVSRKRDHAWFAGFAPSKSPRYAFTVLIEHGGYGGKSAAPVAAKLLRHLLK